MASRLTLQCYSAWPVSIDLEMLRAYTSGFSVDETLQLMLDAAAKFLKYGEGDTALPSASPEVLGNRLSDSATAVCVTGSVDCVTEAPSAEDGGHVEGDEGRSSTACLLARGTCPSGSSKRSFHEELQRTLARTAVQKSVYLRKEIEEQFNIFDALRNNYLATPYAFLSSYAICMALEDRRLLVEEYYSVDEEVLKFFFGDSMHKLELDGEPEKRLLFWILQPKRRVDLDKLWCAGVSDGSLKRQWENLKRVCTFLHSAYRGRGGKVVPRNTPLLTALRQCFALRDSLGMEYATFVFGFEHQLQNRFFKKLPYTECTSFCSVLATMWCDESRLMLRQSFCSACVRIARLLDENRVVAEIHQMAFGEAMRPRWQQQLDGMQRAIATNKGVNNGNASHSKAEGSITAQMIPPATTNVPPDLLPRNNTHQFSEFDSLSRVPSVSLPLKREGYSCTFASSPGSVDVGHEPNSACSALSFQIGNATTSSVTAASPTGLSYAHLSANGAFSRRFLLEYSSIIKSLCRIAAVIGNSGALRDALDIFYSRVYVPLESMGVRLACSQAADSGGWKVGGVGPPVTPLCATDADGLNGSAVLPEHVDKDGLPEDTDGGCFVAELPRWSQSTTEEKVSLLSATPAVQATGAPCVGGGTTHPTRMQAPQTPPRAMSRGGVAPSNDVSGIGDRGVYLRELCVLFNLLSNIFPKLSQITEEDHTECDSEFISFILTFKVLMQIIMASDDGNFCSSPR